MNIDTVPEVVILMPDTDPYIWQEFDPLVFALIEQGGVVIAVDYHDDIPAHELVAVRRVFAGDDGRIE